MAEKRPCSHSLRSSARAALLIIAALIASSWLPPAPARANGFELTGLGTRALGRGGAYASRADDPMALAYNPARLADLDGYQVLIGAQLLIWNPCFTRGGTTDVSRDPTAPANSHLGEGYSADPTVMSGPFTLDVPPTVFADTGNLWASRAYPTVCNGAPPVVIPQLVASFRLADQVGIGFGLITPNAAGTLSYSDNGVVDYGGTPGPNPGRYSLESQQILLFQPSIGVGYRPMKEISFGLTLIWGIAQTDFSAYSTGQQYNPALDIHYRYEGLDWFVPAMILSVHMNPLENLDITVFGQFSDAIGGELTSSDGTFTATTAAYAADPAQRRTEVRQGSATVPNIPGTTLRAPQQQRVGLSIRYGHPVDPCASSVESARASNDNTEDGSESEERSSDSGVVRDRMLTEVFDIELDAVYEINSGVNDFVLQLPGTYRAQIGPNPLVASDIPNPLPAPKGFADAINLRIGGDYNIIPGLFTARAGMHWDQPIDGNRYVGLDFLNGARIGIHLGATVRIERVDISLAYAHVFQLDQTITNGNLRAISALDSEGTCPSSSVYDPSNPITDRGCYPSNFAGIVNNGKYTASADMVALTVNYHLPE